MDNFYYNGEITRLVEILKNKLYFGVLCGTAPKTLRNTNETLYFNVDDEFTYINFYYDFGPLNISCLYRYCCKLNSYMQSGQGFKRIIHYTTADPNKRANSAFLIGSYAIIYLKMDPRLVYKILLKSGGRFKDFLDASQGISQYSISLLDTFQAIAKALAFKFFDFNDFNVFEYDTHDKLHNGDMNWIIPRKFLALIGPTDSYDALNGHSPAFYINYFIKNDIKTVIRLNNKLYNPEAFRKVGIDHIDLFFPDGTTPPREILTKFLQIAETTPAALAVHCKAGLGRTGSLIGAYIMKHYRFTAREAIAWMRICRPGSVIGQQQGWLEKIEGWLWREGRQYRCHYYGDGDKIPRHEYGVYSIEWPKERQMRIRNAQIKSADVHNRYNSGSDSESVKKISSATDKRTRKMQFHELEKRRGYKESESELKRLTKILSRPKVMPKTVSNDMRHASTATQKDFITNSHLLDQQDLFRDPFASLQKFRTAEKHNFGDMMKRGNENYGTYWNSTGQVYLPKNKSISSNQAFINAVQSHRQEMKKLNEDIDPLRHRGMVKMNPKGPDLEKTQGDLLNVIKLRRQLNARKSKM